MGLPDRWWGPQSLDPHLLPPTVHSNRKLDSDMKPGSQALHAQCRLCSTLASWFSPPFLCGSCNYPAPTLPLQ